jgi:hypothetical protein
MSAYLVSTIAEQSSTIVMEARQHDGELDLATSLGIWGSDPREGTNDQLKTGRTSIAPPTNS